MLWLKIIQKVRFIFYLFNNKIKLWSCMLPGYCTANIFLLHHWYVFSLQNIKSFNSYIIISALDLAFLFSLQISVLREGLCFKGLLLKLFSVFSWSGNDNKDTMLFVVANAKCLKNSEFNQYIMYWIVRTKIIKGERLM